MRFIPENIYHIYNQGNNRQRIFYSDDDYIIFIKEIRKYLINYVDIIAYCLMPNHFHFLVFTDTRCTELTKQGGIFIDPVTNGIRKLLSGYARIFNKHYEQTGSLFRQKTKAKCLSDNPVTIRQPLGQIGYYFNCFHYIHQNPLRSGLVKAISDWEYSSFKDYAGLRNGTLCNKELAKKYCLYEPNEFIKTSQKIIPEEETKKFFYSR